MVVVSQKKVPDKLMVPDFFTNLYQITPQIGCCVTGQPSDGKAIVTRMREVASKFRTTNGYPIPVHYLAQKLSDFAQVYTQHAFMRPYSVVTTLVAIDDEKGPQLYKIDPAGHFMGYKACAAGQKDQRALTTLEKTVKDDAPNNWSMEETIEKAIEALQEVIGGSVTPKDIEVGILSVEDPVFTRLNEDTIEEYLNLLAERD